MTRVGRPQERALRLSEGEREDLERISCSLSAPPGVVRRAQIVLASAAGETNAAIARRFAITTPTVCHWRKRWFEQGIVGLYGEARPGRPKTHDEESVAQLLRTVLASEPPNGAHWTVRSVAAATGLAKTTVGRMLALQGVQPHRSRSFRLSTDPLFVEKVMDIVGLYLNSPAHALVLCVDEKPHTQARERAQPVLPVGSGYPEGVAPGYVRQGTATLFAALDIANGQVIAQSHARHRHRKFLAFLHEIEGNVPPGLDAHVVIDNYVAHKHPKVRAWLSERPRFHLHYTSTYASWLNLVERWFALLAQRQIRRASFVSAPDLVGRIDAFVQAYDAKAKPFVWAATSKAILEKVERSGKPVCGIEH